MGYLFKTFDKFLLTSYRAFDLENNIPGGSHTYGFPMKTIPVITKHDRGRLTVMAQNNEEIKMT